MYHNFTMTFKMLNFSDVGAGNIQILGSTGISLTQTMWATSWQYFCLPLSSLQLILFETFYPQVPVPMAKILSAFACYINNTFLKLQVLHQLEIISNHKIISWATLIEVMHSLKMDRKFYLLRPVIPCDKIKSGHICWTGIVRYK